MRSDHDTRRSSGGLLVAAGAGLLMVVCYALPLLVAGGALAGVGGVLGSPWVIGAGIVIVTTTLVAGRRRRRKVVRGCCPPAPPAGADHGTDTKEDRNR